MGIMGKLIGGGIGLIVSTACGGLDGGQAMRVGAAIGGGCETAVVYNNKDATKTQKKAELQSSQRAAGAAMLQFV